MKGSRSAGRVYWVAVRAMVVFTAVVGIAYTLVITGVGQLALPAQADGSLVRSSTGQVVGSRLIGQSFADVNGNPLPQYFQPRPSAAGTGYDAGASSGSNYGPNNTDLIAAITKRKAGSGTSASPLFRRRLRSIRLCRVRWRYRRSRTTRPISRSNGMKARSASRRRTS